MVIADPIDLNNSAAEFIKDGHWEPARRLLETALGSAPHYNDARHNFGLCLLASGESKKAAKQFLKVVETSPKNYDTGPSRSEIMKIAKGYGGAYGIDLLHNLLHFLPYDTEALNLLGVILQEQGKYLEAMTVYQAAIKTDNHFDARHNLSNVLFLLGDHDHSRWVAANLLMEDQYPEELKSVEKSALLFKMLTSKEVGTVNGFQQVIEQFNVWGEQQQKPEDRVFVSPAFKKHRIRVGFVSADFCAHSARTSFEPLLTQFDSEIFDVFAYSNSDRNDQFTEALVKKLGKHRWFNISKMTDQDVADMIYVDCIDVLIDLSGHTAGHRLGVFAKKPAPIQITGLGFGFTTGLAAMDYAFTDPSVYPNFTKEQFPIVEKHLELTSLIHWAKPVEDVPIQKVNNGSIVFANFGSQFKITSEFLETASKILRASEEKYPFPAKLLLKNHILEDKDYCKALTERVVNQKKWFHLYQLELIGKTSQHEHMALLNKAHVFLDTWPYHSGITACEAMYMGLPVVTMDCPGMRGSVSINSLNGIRSAKDVDQYIDFAIDHARIATTLPGNQKAEAQEIRKRFSQSRVCNTHAFVREVYSHIEKVYKEWCAEHE